jgi:folate-dependent tRNA-U54 methylase TrmFO/GidA
MYILTNKANIVVYITTDAILKSDGIHVGNNLVFSDKTLNIISIDTIPTDVIIQKYCYTDENGFYLNSSYSDETNNTVVEQVNYILSKINNTVDINTLTLDEMKTYQISKVG